MSALSAMFTLFFLSCSCILPILAASIGPELGGGIGGGIAGLIILILDIIAIVDVLKSPRDILPKLLWILLILFFPIGGLIIWCLCGRKTTGIV
ncbi:unnamed protein product [Adineta steineri]|uniref:Cardiolipin synthase N-terminal domain-containing protein n=1 Tax=Adineta steineri TaxID=433720 RepID=A0A814H3P4_9BILA|nr:unnamed protein product [Adineta steineri]CAF3949090.1 unnamed protein product [Adineta steineri]